MYPRPNPTEKAINDAPSAIGLRPDKNPNVSECSTSMCGVWIPNDSSRYSVKRWCIPSSADNPIIPIPIVILQEFHMESTLTLVLHVCGDRLFPIFSTMFAFFT